MLGEFHNRTRRRQAYDCDKGIEKSISKKVVLWETQHYFFNDLVGLPRRKKSKAIYEGMTTREFQGVQRIP